MNAKELLAEYRRIKQMQQEARRPIKLRYVRSSAIARVAKTDKEWGQHLRKYASYWRKL